jgi:hypothetical protein
MSGDIEQAATWKRVTASILDFFTAFFVGGYLIGLATGQTTGLALISGHVRLALFALIVVYFFVGRRYRRNLVGPDLPHRATAAAYLVVTQTRNQPCHHRRDHCAQGPRSPPGAASSGAYAVQVCAGVAPLARQ